MNDYSTGTLTIEALIIIGVLLLLPSMFIKYSHRPNKSQQFVAWLLEWFGDLSHEFAGAIITGFILYFLVTAPLEIISDYEVGDEIARQARSSDPSIAQIGYDTIREKLLYRTGVLANTNLSGVNWQGETFMDFELNGVIFSKANLTSSQFLDGTFRSAVFDNAILDKIWINGTILTRANFRFSSLESAYLWELDLCQTIFDESILTDTDFQNSNLNNATFRNAKLKGISFLGANLEGADFTGVSYDPQTILPDGTFWIEQALMNRFINKNDPEFYRATSDRVPPCSDS